MANMKTTHELILKYDGYVQGMTKAALAAERLKTARQRTATETARTAAAEANAQKTALALAAAQTRAAGSANNVRKNATLAGKAVGNMAGNTLLASQQIQDFAIQVAGGQNPLLALVQQGSQLQYQFRSIGNAIKGVGNILIRGLTNPAVIATASLGSLALAYNQGANESEALAASLIKTNDYLGMSAGQVEDLASAMDRANDYTQAYASEALATLISTGRVGSENLERLANAAINLERYGGGSIKAFAKDVADLSKDPFSASVRLNESMRYLNSETIARIRLLQDQGDLEEAVALAQNAYADATNNMANRLKENLGLLERSWISVKNAAKEAWDAMLDIGRRKSLEEQIAVQIKALEDLAPGSQAFENEMNILIRLQDQLKVQNAKTASKEQEAKATERTIRGLQVEGNLVQKVVQARTEYLREFDRIQAAGEQGRDTVRAMGLAAQPEGMDSQLAQQRERQIEELNKLAAAQDAARQAGLENEEEFQNALNAIVEKGAKERRDIETANIQMAVQSAQEGFDALAQAALEDAKKRSDLYRGLFNMSKAFAIANAIINIQEAISKAWTGQFPANIAAAAQVAAATASIVSNINAVKEPPKFHGGGIIGEEVSITGLRGEGVFTKKQMENLAPVGSTGNVEVNVYNAPPGTTVNQSRGEDGRMRIDVLVEQLVANTLATQGSPGNRVMRGTYGMRPQLVQRG